MSKAPTMKDVARLAGVSVQTVSAVVNERPEITTATRERVQAAIQTLGYRPFSVARSLRTRRTHTIALVVSNVANPSLGAMASAAEDYAHSHGYNLVLYNTHSDPARERAYMRTVAERWIDGVVMIAIEDQMLGASALKAAGIPVVPVDRVSEDYEGPSVMLDNVKVGQLAAQHLLSLGHTHLAHISGPVYLRSARDRAIGFSEEIEAHGAHLNLSLQREEDYNWDWHCRSGYRAMRSILETRPLPTAVFAASDLMAIGAMHAADEAGLRVPDDISVMGVDDIEVAAFQVPPLTTLVQPFDQVGALGVQALLTLLDGGMVTPERIVVDPVLVVRSSTSAPRADRGEVEGRLTASASLAQ